MRRFVAFVVVTVATFGALLACMGEQTPVVVSAPAPNAAPSPSPAAPTPAEIPFYSATPLVRKELKELTLRELSLRRNTIFARVGNPFNKKWLHDYFATQSWYHPLPRAELEKLSEVDRRNAALIGEVESSFTKPELRARKARLVERVEPEDIIEYDLINEALGEYAGDPALAAAQRSPLEDPEVLAKRLTSEQIADLSRRDLRLTRNTIFARHGRSFQSPILAAWFAQKGWYDIDPNYSDAMLTEIDKANITLLKAREEELGGAMTDADHDMEEGLGMGAA